MCNLVTCRNTYVTTFLILKKWLFIFFWGFLVLSDLQIFLWLSFGNLFTPAVSTIHISGILFSLLCAKHFTSSVIFCANTSLPRPFMCKPCLMKYLLDEWMHTNLELQKFPKTTCEQIWKTLQPLYKGNKEDDWIKIADKF